MIPAEAAAFLGHACRTLDIDPAALAERTGVDGVPVPAPLAAVLRQLGTAEHTQYLPWDATSQDIMNTALALRRVPTLAGTLVPTLKLRQTRVVADQYSPS